MAQTRLAAQTLSYPDFSEKSHFSVQQSTNCITPTLIQHFEKNLPRMDYPRYQRQGWQIGSGSVEAACKTVIGGRLKGAGMRWGEDGADAVSHLRALFLSENGQWDAFWAAPRN